MSLFWMKWAGVAAILAALSACATGPRTVDAQVRTVAAQPPGAAVLNQAHYRFDRVPPAAGQPAPDKLEAMAQAALARVGLQRDDAGAAISVQVGATSGAYWADGWGRPLGWGPRMSLGMGFGRGWRGGAFGWGMGWPLDDPSVPVYVSEVSLLMRDLRTGQIVYDTRARHDGPWSDTDNILPALFTAALEGFPNPAQTERPVGVPLLPVAAGGSALATPTTGAGTPTPVAPAVQPAAPVRGAPVMVTPQR